MNFNTKFEMKQKVMIPDLEKKGKITGFWVGEDLVVQYHLRFFDNGHVVVLNCDEDELKEIKR